MAEYKRPEDFETMVYDQWKSAVDSNQAQLDRETEDLSWQVAENMWDADAREARSASVIQGIAIAGRPCLAIPKQKQPMSIVDAQFRGADLGVNIHPLSEDADDDTAEVMQDAYRAIERNSNASQARWWAFDRAKQAGRGWYRVNTVYDESTQDPFDQAITIERILYQSSVVMDPSATKADCSDAQYAFLSAWVPFDSFKRRWPKASLAKADADIEFKLLVETIRSQTPNWVDSSFDGGIGKKGVRVAEYWHKEYESEKITSEDGSQTRIRQNTVLRWTVLGPGKNGLEVLEEQRWNGDDIPLIPAVWTELQPFDTERRYEGMIRPSRDSLKLYNFTASEAVSVIGTLPKSPWIGDVEQFEPYMQAWQQSSVRTLPFLPTASVIKNGQLLPPPSRVQADASGLQPLMMMLSQADQFIQSTTATPDPVLGFRNQKAESGKAIQALQGQSEAANSSGIQNFAEVTMQYEAKVVLGMFKYIYDRPGRVLHVLNSQGDRRAVMLNKPFVTDPRGRPMPAMGPTSTMQPQKPKMYDFSKGIYGVSVTVGKSFNTRVEQGAAQLAGIMDKDPELGVVLAPIFLRFQEGPGMKEAAELAKEYRDRKFGPMGGSKDGRPDPAELEAKLKAAEGKMQQMEQAGMELQKQVDTDQAKQAAMLQKAQIDAEIEKLRIQADIERARMDNAARVQVAEIAASAKIDAEQIAAKVALILQEAKNAEEDKERRHEAEISHGDRAHDVAMTMGTQEHDDERADIERSERNKAEKD